MHRPRRPFRSAVALLVPAVFALAACGDDEPAAAPAAATADESMSDEAMSDESMMDETMSDEAMSGESMSDEAMSDEAMSDEAMSDETHDDAMSDEMTESMTEEMSDEMTDEMSDEAMADLAAWQTIEITDVDGETFTLYDLVGTPVVVEAFATWCPNCREQLGKTDAAAATLGDGVEVLALSVETDLDPAEVAKYADDNGFDNVRFAVMSPELLAALVDAFGNSVANPPSTPKFVIDAMGHAGELTTGFESPDEIMSSVAEVTG